MRQCALSFVSSFVSFSAVFPAPGSDSLSQHSYLAAGGSAIEGRTGSGVVTATNG